MYSAGLSGASYKKPCKKQQTRNKLFKNIKCIILISKLQNMRKCKNFTVFST